MKDTHIIGFLKDMNSKIDAIAEGVTRANEKLEQLTEQVRAIKRKTA